MNGSLGRGVPEQHLLVPRVRTHNFSSNTYKLHSTKVSAHFVEANTSGLGCASFAVIIGGRCLAGLASTSIDTHAIVVALSSTVVNTSFFPF